MNTNNLKVGGTLLCHTGLSIFISRPWLTPGETYKIIEIDYLNDSICVIDDEGDRNSFKIKGNYADKNFSRYFYTTKEIRKQKLDKINENNLQ